MHTTRHRLEEQLVAISRRLQALGWVANHDGNASVRLGDDRYICTPTAVSKGDVRRETLLVVDGHGKRVSGRTKPFSELDLHLYCYRERPTVMAVLHAHPPTATGLAVAGVRVLSTLLAESVVSLGPEIPLVPYACPKTPASTLNLAPHIQTADAFLLERHGVITVGPDLETACLRMELVEHLAKIQCVAHQVGHVRELPPDDVARLLEARAKAGLALPKA